MRHILDDLRFGSRLLRKHRGYTAVAVLTLALGIGATTAIFSFLDNVLLKPLPYPDPDRIVRVTQARPNGDFFLLTTMDLFDWQRENTSFEYIAPFRATRYSVSRPGRESLIVNAYRVSPSYFDISRTPPLLGRVFTDSEAEFGRDAVVVLSHGFWRQEFGGDAAAVGQTVLVDDVPHTIVGVMPPGTTFDRGFPQLWKPFAFAPGEQTRGLHWIDAVARLKPGVTVADAQTDLDRLAARFGQMYPETNNGFGARVRPYAEEIVPTQLRTRIIVLFVAAGMVLLIGCANLANLALARGLARSREVAVRSAVGARRADLLRQFLIESVLVALIGGTFALPVAYGTMRWLQQSVAPLSIPAEAALQFDLRVFGFAAVASVVTALLFGLVPALRVTRPDLAAAMKDGSRGTVGGGTRSRLRAALIVGEVAVAFMLLVGAGLLMRTFFALQTVEAAENPDGLMAMTLPMSAATYAENLPALRAYLRSIEEAVQATPGVRSAALSSSFPLRGVGSRYPSQRADRDLVVRPRRPLPFVRTVTPSYFQTVGLRLVRGRYFAESDREDTSAVVIVNERFAGELWPGENPVGKSLLVPRVIPGRPDLGEDIAREIVGVVADERMTAHGSLVSALYTPVAQTPPLGALLAVRAEGDPLALVRAIRSSLDSINPQQAIGDVQTLNQLKAMGLMDTQLQTTVLMVFSVLALLLAAIGIYGVISNLVMQRTDEMAVRTAMGATAGGLLWLVVRSGMTLAVLGLMLGVGGAWLGLRGLTSLLVGVTSHDPITFLLAVAVLFLVSLLACLIPARRAMRVDLITVLR